MTTQKQTMHDISIAAIYTLAAIIAIITPILHISNMKTSNAMGCMIFGMLTWGMLKYKKNGTPTYAIILTIMVLAIIPAISNGISLIPVLGQSFYIKNLAIQSGLDLPARWIGILGGWAIYKTTSYTRIACVTLLSLFAIWIAEYGFTKWFSFAILP